jgi:seryl-tRNA synthetase
LSAEVRCISTFTSPTKDTRLRNMSSGFVSGGTADAPIERDDEWKQAQREIEEKRREKEELGKQNEGKSLYEVLQANKGDTAQRIATRFPH